MLHFSTKHNPNGQQKQEPRPYLVGNPGFYRVKYVKKRLRDCLIARFWIWPAFGHDLIDVLRQFNQPAPPFAALFCADDHRPV